MITPHTPCLTDIFYVLWPYLSCWYSSAKHLLTTVMWPCLLCVMSLLSAHICPLLSHVMSLLASVMDGCDLCYQNAPLKGHLAMIQEYEHTRKLITKLDIFPFYIKNTFNMYEKCTRVKSVSKRAKNV